MNNKIKIIIFGLCFTSFNSHSIGIDSMIKFSEENKSEFIITSAEDYRQFIQVGVSEINVVDGEIKKTEYVRSNIDKWSLLVRPARTIIEPKLNKTFKVEYDLKNFGMPMTDKVYQLSFIPTPYFSEGEPITHSVKVAMGFAPILIVPAKEDKPLSYKIKYEKNNVYIENNGRTYIRAVLDSCPKNTISENKERCSKVSYILSGRKLNIELHDQMVNAKKMNIELSTHHLDFKETLDMVQSEVVSNKGI
ncbi:hypothetical protein [Vibrio sp. E150_018]